MKNKTHFKILRTFLHILITSLLITITSCSSVNPYIKHNYFNGGTLINDTLNISAELSGDIKYHPIKRKEIKKKIRGVKELKYRDLLLFGTTYISPYYDMLLFYNTNENKITDSIETTILLKDTLVDTNRILIKKSLENKNIYLYLQSVNPTKNNDYLILDAEQIINTVRFDTLIKSELTYQKIFYNYIDNDNYLYIKNKFETAPIKQSEKSDWNKFQYLATVLSHDASNKEHKKLLDNFEIDRKIYFQKKIDSLLINNEGIITSKNAVIEKIATLARSNKIVMLNENHWYPNHRILATKLLNPLKESGYTYLAIEAVGRDKDTLLVNDKNTELFGKRNYPTKSTGYYTREPYFGIFIREALNLGYKIISYDYSDGEEREISQAKNIKKIIEKDPNAKIFVYAGLAHIYEGNTRGTKRMAEYFKEITNINPLTIDQTHLFGNTQSELALFEANLFEGEERLNTNVDYLIINHIKPTLDNVFEKETMTNFSLVEEELNNYLNKEILISIYYFEEYKKYKSSSVPIFNKITKLTSNQIDLHLPIGNYYLKIRDINDNLILSKEIQVIKSEKK